MPRKYPTIKFECDNSINIGKFEARIATHRGNSGASLAKLMNLHQKFGRSTSRNISYEEYLNQLKAVLDEGHLSLKDIALRLNIGLQHMQKINRLRILPLEILQDTHINRPLSGGTWIGVTHLAHLAKVQAEFGSVLTREIYVRMKNALVPAYRAKYFVRALLPKNPQLSLKFA